MNSGYFCPGCKEKELARFRIVFDSYQKLFKCGTCGLIFRARFATMNQSIDYVSMREDIVSLQNNRRGLFYRRMFHLAMQRAQSGGAFLDIGSGDGILLQIAQENGVGEAIGIELNKDKCEYVTNTLRQKCLNKYYTADLFPGACFDLIHHSHVIEHIEDPHAFIAANYAHLKRGGVLFFTFPPASSVNFMLDKVKRNAARGHVIQEQHYNYLNRSSTVALLRNAGFKDILYLCGNQYLKRHHSKARLVYRFLVDPAFRLLHFGEPYVFCSK
jgi:2-polyprenyl-3-methyl-5-hydroxy-6-metoxy-1,4-benzoquinol methylase